MKGEGVNKGDTVIIYMPMIPEALVAMLACARIGAVHSVVFGGFAAHELAIRIDHAQPKVIVLASGAIEGRGSLKNGTGGWGFVRARLALWFSRL